MAVARLLRCRGRAQGDEPVGAAVVKKVIERRRAQQKCVVHGARWHRSQQLQDAEQIAEESVRRLCACRTQGSEVLDSLIRLHV